MPPAKKFSKEDIIKASCQIILKEGISCVNARRIAKELGCSIQPIFHNFANMEDVNKAIYQSVYEQYKSAMLASTKNENSYKEMGLAYIRFARDYPAFFKMIFMQETNQNIEEFIMTDAIGENVITAGQELTELSFEEQKSFHSKVWIFTHGLACLVANKTIQFSDQEIRQLLGNSVKEMLLGFKLERKNNEKYN